MLAPLIVVGELLALVVSVAVTIVGVPAAAVDRSRRLLRVGAFGVAYLTVELVTLSAALGAWMTRRAHRVPWWEDYHCRLTAWALRSILAAAHRCLGFRVELDQEHFPAGLEDERPVLVLARHGGPGDSFAVVSMLLDTYHRRVRVVLKEALAWEPLIDVVLGRLGACFLPSCPGPGEDLPARLATLASGLTGRDALLLFPEGGNWTPRRWRGALSRLRRDAKHEAAVAAALMPNVLPPRPAGVLACLEARPELEVVIVAHTGLDTLTRPSHVWKALPFRRPMVIRTWPSSPRHWGSKLASSG